MSLRPHSADARRRLRARLGLGLAAVFMPLPATRMRAEEAGPVLGVMTHFAQGWDPRLAQVVAGAGIRSVRDELYWQDVEPEPGHYVFPARYECYMEALREEAVSPLIELTFANKGYDGGMTPFTQAGFDGYAAYGVAVLRHYGRQIGAVELWNEYNGSFCKGPAQKDRAGTYARMIQVAYAALKSERPDLQVAGAATSGVPLPYLEHLFSLGALDSMDAVSIHPYRFNTPPEGIEQNVERLDRLIRRYNAGKPKPIWVTELGWATKPAAAPLDLAITPTDQASFLVRAYALLLSAGVERIYWYLLRDYDAFATMGLVHADAASTPKPAYQALKTLQAAIGTARAAGREPTLAGFYSVLFRRTDGTEVRIVWSLQPRTLYLPAGCRATTMLGDPVTGAAVEVGDAPLFIEGPLSGLPPADPDQPRRLATSSADFAGRQDAEGWSYGFERESDGLFVALPRFVTSDWKSQWEGPYPFLSIAETEQHPAVARNPSDAVGAVRRWTSSRAQRVALHARFRAGARGDGVRVAVSTREKTLFGAAIGGRNPARADFDAVLALSAGDPVDFAVFPATAANADFDATEVEVTLDQAR